MEDNQSQSSESSEPYLNYCRLQDDIEKQAETEIYTSIALHERYTAVGTNSGKILLFNNKNKLFKIFNSHVGKVNCLSVDKTGDTIASAGEDGNVYLQILSENSRIPHKYTTAIRSVCLDPASKEKLFVCGGLKGQLILNKKSWFSYQDVVIHEKQGPISTIAFSYPFVTWCNEYGTKIYNVDTETSIMFIDKPANVPNSNECKPRLCWYGNSRLCIGWGEVMTIVQMNYKTTPAGNKVWYGEQKYQNTVPFWICGIGIYDDDHITVLSYYPPDEEGPQPPSIHVLSLQTGESLSEECLPLPGYEGYSAMDYQLVCNVTAPTSSPLPLYLVAPHTIIRITPRSVQDHIDWAVEHHDYEHALTIVTDKNNNFSNDHIVAIKEQHLDYLFSVNKIEQAASLCSSYLGKDTTSWER